jgi:4-hydroxy-tetrahydrodipicolinate synthase
VLSGDDGLTLPFMACGAKGVVSVASNIMPKEVSHLVNAALQGHYQEALEIHLKNFQFFNDIFIEPNPVPIKTLLYLKGLIESPEVRLPLSPPSEVNQKVLKSMAESLHIA